MTSTDDDLISSLGAFGAFVEAEIGEQLRPLPSELEFVDAEKEVSEVVGHASRFEPRRLLVAAAVLLFVIGGVVGLQGFVRDSGSVLVSAEAPIDGPLLVLPDAELGWVVNNGQVDQVDLPPDAVEMFPFVGGVIGVPDDGGYVNLIRIGVLSRSAFLNEADLEQLGETSIYRPTGEQMGERLIEDRGDRAVWLSTLKGSIDQPEEIFDLITFAVDGTLGVADGAGFELIDQWALEPSEVDVWSSSFDLEADGQRFFVETAEVPATFSLDIGDRVEEISIGGRSAWLAEINGNSYGVAWQATPTQSVFISPSEDGAFTADQFLVVAESLRLVDRDRWFAVFPSLEDPETE